MVFNLKFQFILIEKTTLTVGQDYTLTCTISGASIATYHWRKDGVELSGSRSSILHFSPLRLSDAGIYTCEVSVGSHIYSTFQEIDIEST